METYRTYEMSLSGEIIEILTEEKSRSIKLLIRPFSLLLPDQQDAHLGETMTLDVGITVRSTHMNLNNHQGKKTASL